MKEHLLWEEKNLIAPPMKSESNPTIVQNDTISETETNVIENLWRDTGKISGIYKIINKVNGKYYVGSGKNINKGYASRWSKHKCYLRNNKHSNQHLQNSWNMYGEMAFEFVIERQIDVNHLLEEEQKYLDVAKMEQDKCYNLCFIAGRPHDLCEESRRSQIAKLKLHYANPLIRAELSRRERGRKVSEEVKEHLRRVNSGKNSPRYGIKISKEELEMKVDKTIYSFRNKNSGEVFVGRRYDFVKKYNLNDSTICRLIKRYKGVHSVKGWIVV